MVFWLFYAFDYLFRININYVTFYYYLTPSLSHHFSESEFEELLFVVIIWVFMHTKGFLLRVWYFFGEILFIFALCCSACVCGVRLLVTNPCFCFCYTLAFSCNTYIQTDLWMSVCTYFLLAHSCAHFFCFICYTIYTHLIRRVELR